MKLQTLGLSPPEKRSAPSVNVGFSTTLGQPATWQNLFGGNYNEAGESVTPQNAMGLPAVHAAVLLISESIASMSPKLYKQTENGRVLAKDHPLYRLLTLEPSTDSTAFSLWANFVSSIALHGNGYIEIQRNSLNEVTGLWFLPPYAVQPTRLESGLIGYRVSQVAGPGQTRTLPATSVVHVPWFAPYDCVVGLSPIGLCRTMLGTSMAADKFMARTIGSNSTPSGVLQLEGKAKPEDKMQAKSDWEKLQGRSNQGTIAVLDQQTKFVPLQMSNQDQQFIEGMRFTREQVAGIFRLHASMLGSESRVSGETFFGQQQNLLSTCLRPWLDRIEQELKRKLLPGTSLYEIEHDTSRFLKSDQATEIASLKSAVSSGLMSPNEARQSMGWNPGGPELDDFFLQVNMATVKNIVAGKVPAPSSKNEPATDGDTNV